MSSFLPDLPSLSDLMAPQALHAAIVHFPIALAIVGIPLVYLSAVLGRERSALCWVTVGCYALLAGVAYLAVLTGRTVAGQASPLLSQEAAKLLELHEDMAELVWMFAAGTTALLLLSLIKVRWVHILFMALAMIASLLTGVWVGMVGHYGGTLVYEHGVGTPISAPLAEIAPDLPPPGGETTEGPSMELVPPEETAEPTLPDLVEVKPIDLDAAQRVSYLYDVYPILEKHCLSCHGPDGPAGNIDLSGALSMMKSGRKAGIGVVPRRPDESSVVRYIRGELQPRMPKGRAPLTVDELHTIRMWIAAGARDDSTSILDPNPIDLGP